MPSSLRLSSYIGDRESDHRLARAMWEIVKRKADYVVRAGQDEIAYGEDLELDYDEVEAVEQRFAKDKKPYGDVEYADPGYQADKKKRYPINTPEHVRAAWNYINKSKNSGKYSSEELSHIKSKIVSAWKKLIDKDGPPSAKE